ncbi:MAG: hypothetical protein Q8862_05410 [Bacteroidota bacterium]|nr:hypothetical protein [Bacteroidota bacterium]
MIKKVSHIILALLLILATAGLTISKHYCGNNLVSVSLSGQDKSCCGDNCGCCHTKTTHVQVSETFVFSASDIQLDTPVFCVPVQTEILLSHPKYTLKQAPLHLSDPAPPSYDSISSFLQVFLC